MTDPTLTDTEGRALWIETHPADRADEWERLLPQTRRAYGNLARDPECKELRRKLRADRMTTNKRGAA